MRAVKDPRKRYLSLVSLEKSHVNLRPPIIFLFGGEVGTSVCSCSVRSKLYHHIYAKESELFGCLVIPEDFTDWLHDSNYPDLLTFESDLAQTSSVVFIALESPGAIAELGAFSVNGTLKNKVHVIMSEVHYDQRSFIKLGPLRQLPDENIYSYNYDPLSIGGSLDNYLGDMVSNIKESTKSGKKSEPFAVENNGHIALLIYEMLCIFKALKLTEIAEYLDVLSCSRSRSEIKRFLFLLDKLDFVEMQRYGNVDYYYPLKVIERVALSGKSRVESFDRHASEIGALQFYHEAAEEKGRRRVIEVRNGKL